MEIKHRLNICPFLLLFLLILVLVNNIVLSQEIKEDELLNVNKELSVYGYVEYVFLGPDNLRIKAKLDSGAKTSSLNALDIVKYDQDGEEWIKFNMIDPGSGEKVAFERKIMRYVKIKQHKTKAQIRPVVVMDVWLGGTHIEREFSLTSRDKFIYQVLLGRNFIDGIALIDVSKKFLANTNPAFAKKNR